MAVWRETFYRCDACDSIVMKFGTQGEVPSCCGKPMEVLVPHTEEFTGGASSEKHLPRAKRGKIFTVTVGEGDTMHPMEDDHYIEWIYVVTEMGSQMVKLKPGIAPYAEFALNGDIPLAVYAYCNKHGLWVTRLRDSMQDDDQ